jgi:hypothetical protein
MSVPINAVGFVHEMYTVMKFIAMVLLGMFVIKKMFKILSKFQLFRQIFRLVVVVLMGTIFCACKIAENVFGYCHCWNHSIVAFFDNGVRPGACFMCPWQEKITIVKMRVHGIMNGGVSQVSTVTISDSRAMIGSGPGPASGSTHMSADASAAATMAAMANTGVGAGPGAGAGAGPARTTCVTVQKSDGDSVQTETVCVSETKAAAAKKSRAHSRRFSIAKTKDGKAVVVPEVHDDMYRQDPSPSGSDVCHPRTHMDDFNSLFNKPMGNLTASKGRSISIKRSHAEHD